MRLEKKTAVVTGGTRGIGFATVKAFLREGAKVALCGSTPESAANAVNRILEEDPKADIMGLAPKLDSIESVRKAYREVVEKFGSLDIVVNNAGISDSTPLSKYTEESFDRVMDLNFKGVFNSCKAALEYMETKHSGVIINTSSVVSIYGQPAGCAYPASKFAVNGLTLSLAREFGPKGIRVNAVAPGITETDMMKAVPKEVIAPLIAQIPLHRLGQPEDIANAILFLSSDEASYITGVVLRVDGLARV